MGRDFPYVWAWRASQWRALDRKGECCRVICRGTMNSALIEFEDGFRSVVSRNGLRKAPASPQSRRVRRLVQQLDLDGNPHDLTPPTERMSLFEHEAQLPGQTYLDL